MRSVFVKLLTILAGLLLSASAFAASYFSDIVVDRFGNVRSNVSVTVKVDGVTATLYSDAAGTIPKTNPLTSDAQGVFSFYYSTSGAYTFEVSGSVVGTRSLLATGTLVSGGIPLVNSGKALVAPSSGSPFGLSISAAPSSTCATDSINTAFTCDLSHVVLPISHLITGTATLGQPTSGYTYTDNAYPVFGFLYNSSGWNNGASNGSGRTAAVFSRLHGYQAGQGDFALYNGTVFVTSTCPAWVTSFLGCAAGSLFNGNVEAGSDSNYLNVYETIIKDQGHAVAGIGNVNNLVRTNATRPLGDEWWAGYRVQSQGSIAADVAYSARGPFNIGIDLSFLTLPTSGAGAVPFNCVSCAMTLAGDQRIYLNATATDSTSLGRFPSASGTVYLTYNSSQSSLVAAVGGSQVLGVTANGFGYATGSGGTVTQASSKSTGVTVNKPSAQITMNNAALASAAKVTFTVTNSAVAAIDVPVCAVASGGTANAYRTDVTAVAAGSFAVTVENITAGPLSEAPVINCNVIKGASS